ncbi:MAG: hypothetical protein QOF51_542, partial [Chloroflexota bacterium]|nr:hypothetical protein [Chloroflexota bacterium]
LLIAGGGVVDTVTDTVRTAGLLGYWTHVVQDALYPLDAPELRTPGLRVPGGQRTSLAEVLQLVANTERAAEIDASAPGYAMLIIDMQNDFIRPDRPPVVYSGAAPIPPEKRERMLGNASGAAAAMRARGWPVVYLKISWRTDQLDSVHPNGNGVTERFPEGVTYLVNDSWGTEVVAELAPQPGDFVVEKKGASGFGLTYLHRLLRNLGVHRCLVAGGSVTGCVRATVMDGTALGYDMTVLADATYPPESPQPHLDFLAPWARVRTTDEVIAELAQMTAGAPIA